MLTIPLRTIAFLHFSYSSVLRTKHASETGFVYVLWRKNGEANCSARTVRNSNINHRPSDTTAAAVHQVKWILKPGINTILEKISFDRLPTTYNTVRTHNSANNTAFSPCRLPIYHTNPETFSKIQLSENVQNCERKCNWSSHITAYRHLIQLPEHSYRWCNQDEYESMDVYLERGKEKCKRIVHHLQSIPSKTQEKGD